MKATKTLTSRPHDDAVVEMLKADPAFADDYLAAALDEVGEPGGQAALLAALRSGRLGGFALDPLYEEPGRADDELLQFNNVILTPHVAAMPRHNALEDFRDLVRGVAQAVRSQILQ